MVTLRFDGLYQSIDDTGARLSSGFMCYGWLIFRQENVVARGHGGLAARQDASSNCAEYLALIEGLEALLDMGMEAERIKVMGDAKSVIDQMEGRAAVNSLSVAPLHHRACRLVRHFPRMLWVWTPRKQNRAADALTRHAMRQIYANQPIYQDALQAVQGVRRVKEKYILLSDLRIFQQDGMAVSS